MNAKGNCDNVMSVDAEEWFHILDTDQGPRLAQWGALESRAPAQIERLLECFSARKVRVTMFWLGWCAERNPELVRQCAAAGHEIASHSYSHCLAYQTTPAEFREDIHRAKCLLEDITGTKVSGLRCPGFGITEKAPWAFDLIQEAGYEYDSSVFPGKRGHGGLRDARLEPHVMTTGGGELVEIPISMVEVCGRRLCLFGGGYLRLFPLPLIRWGARHLHRRGRPLIAYVHPREVDPDHPRLPLPWRRRFKCYVNLKTTLPKLDWLCQRFAFITMKEMAEKVGGTNALLANLHRRDRRIRA